MPDLDFSIEDAAAPPFCAAPTLLFKLRLQNREPEPVRSVMLKVQVKMQADARSYDERDRERLSELFGLPEQWSKSLKSLLWTETVVLVPAFKQDIVVDVPLTCTYDLDVLNAKYLYAVRAGNIPLEFLFSGTMFYQGRAGLRAAQISWEKETHYSLPARLWHEMMDHFFPNSAWLRLQKDAYDALFAYKARHSLPTWEATLQQLLAQAQPAPAPPPRVEQEADLT